MIARGFASLALLAMSSARIVASRISAVATPPVAMSTAATASAAIFALVTESFEGVPTAVERTRLSTHTPEATFATQMPATTEPEVLSAIV